MRIPTKFKLLGHTIKVMYEPEAHYEKGRYGACSFEGKWIKLCPPSPSHPVTQSSLEQTFLHELLHLILYHGHGLEQIKKDIPLYENEAFVDFHAGLLQQVFSTMEYTDEP